MGIVDSNARLMRAGYNKLIEEWKAKNNSLKKKLKFVIAALTDKDKQFKLMAYNALKQRALMLSGVGMGDAEMKKCQLIKRLTNKGYNFQVMAINCIREFLADARLQDELAAAEYERQQKEKDRILRGIMRSIVNSNARLMRAGYNKLIEEWKAKQGALK